jgi:glycosyltransferase involved in cell wall biosynthesis
VPEISVIVPAFNATATIGATLDALADQDVEASYEVLVVDDGSADGTAELATAAGARVLVQGREGPAAARNLGASEARGSLLAFTDADCVPQRQWLREGGEALRGADLVQGRVLPDPRAESKPFDRTLTVTREYGLYETANLFVTRELFASLGGFEDWLPARVGKPLAEDVWFGWKARRSGARVAFCDRALVHHAVFPRGAWAYAAERLRRAYFPAMVARVPELRETFLYRRWFLTRRTSRVDLALAGALVAAVAGRRRSSLAPLASLAALPYARLALTAARRWGRRAPIALAGDLLADMIGFGALVWGSLRHRTPVL